MAALNLNKREHENYCAVLVRHISKLYFFKAWKGSWIMHALYGGL